MNGELKLLIFTFITERLNDLILLLLLLLSVLLVLFCVIVIIALFFFYTLLDAYSCLQPGVGLLEFSVGLVWWTGILLVCLYIGKFCFLQLWRIVWLVQCSMLTSVSFF